MRSWTRQNIELLDYLSRRALTATFIGAKGPYWFSRKYSPDQPRVPAGSREGGQWTSGGGESPSNALADSSRPVRLADAGHRSDSRVMSDASPDPIRPGARYAATEIEIKPNALVGDPRIVSTTVKLTSILAHAMDIVEPGSDALTPQEYGRLVHERFADSVRVSGLPGIGYDDVETTFGGEYYGAKGSIRTDVVLRDETGSVIAIYDVKTGDAKISEKRAAQLRAKVGVDDGVPIYELQIIHGVVRKAFTRWLRFPYASKVKL